MFPRGVTVRVWLPTMCVLLFVALPGCDGGGTNSDACEGDSDCPTGYSCVEGGCYQRLGEGCADLDEDGFSTGPSCTDDMIDCDDADPARYPGAAEVCGDGINQDCLAGADLGCDCAAEAGVGTTRDCNEGACAGVQTCTDSGWGECLPSTAPRPEQCGADGNGRRGRR